MSKDSHIRMGKYIKKTKLSKLKVLSNYGSFSSKESLPYIRLKKYIRKGESDRVVRLLKSESFSPKEKTLIMISAMNHVRYDVIEFLLDDTDVDMNRVNASISPVRDLDFMVFLMDNPHIDWSKSYCDWATHAARNDWIEVLQFMIENDLIDPSMKENILLTLAAWFNRINVVRLLLNDERVDPSANNNKAFYKAFNHKHILVAKMIVLHDHFVASPELCAHVEKGNFDTITDLVVSRVPEEVIATKQKML